MGKRHLPLRHSGQFGAHQSTVASGATEEWPEYSRKKHQSSSKYLKIVAVVVVVLGLATGGYLLFKPNKATAPQSNSSANSTQPAPQVVSGSNSNASLINYVSNGHDLNLSFQYPSNWTVTPPSNDNASDQPIILNSPSTTITAADGSTATGKVTVEVRPGSATISELDSGNPVAAQTSTQMAYSNPTPNQYQYPYLTYLHFQTGLGTPGAFEEVMITGEQTFSAKTPVTSSSLTTLDPIISASFYRCSTTACSGTGSGVLSISYTTWQSDPLFQQVNTILESFKLN